MMKEKYKILFNYKGKATSIQGEINLPMKKILEDFKNKLDINYNYINLRFEYKDEAVNEEITLKEFVSKNKIENDIIEILVIEENDNEIKYFSEEIICPECKEEARIIVTDDKIKLICNQNHNKEMTKAEFIKRQMIIKSNIKCKCNFNSTNTKRYCLTCKAILCTFCEKEHIKNNNKHLIIDYAQKNYFCSEHNKCKNEFIFFCKTCKKNLCWKCFDSHENHQIEKLSEIYDFKDKLIVKHKAFASILKKLEKAIEELKKKYDNIKSTYEMNEIIINNYNIDNRNYIKLINIKEIYEKNFNLQKINNMVKYLNNMNKNNNNYCEINFNNGLSKIKNEEMIKQHNQEIKECNSIISFNKSQMLTVSKNYFINIPRFYEKIEISNEVKNNIDLSEIEQNNYDESANKFSSSKDIILVNTENNNNENESENEEQNDEDKSEEKVNNIIKNIESSDEIIYINNVCEECKIMTNIKENEKNVSEGIIKSCNENKNIIEEYYDYKNAQRIIKEKKDLIVNENRNSTTENQIKLIYNIRNNQEKSIKIFGKNFVKNNKDKCHIIFEKKKYDLTENFDVPDDHRGKIEIFLEGIDKIIDASEMLSDCYLLENFYVCEWDTSNITNMSHMFRNCKSLLSLHDLSKWNMINVTNIKYMFSGCKSLKYLPDLSGWNTNNIINMSHLFEGCESLLSLPEISKWNMKNVTNIDCMFSNCQSLESLPDLSCWNVKSVTSMNHLFMNCKSLLSLPDLSKWDIKNVTSIEYMICGCKSLKVLPDLSRWDVSKVTDMSYLFKDCKSLSSLPDMSKWDIEKLTNIQKMFYGCLKVKEIKIFKNNNKLENINELCYGCQSLLKELDIKGWNLNKIKEKDKENIYGNCYNLKK